MARSQGWLGADKDKQAPESAEKTVRDIRRATKRRFSAEEKSGIVLEGLHGEESIANRASVSMREESTPPPA